MTLLGAVLSNGNRKERQQIVFRERAWTVIFEDFFLRLGSRNFFVNIKPKCFIHLTQIHCQTLL